MTVRPRPALRPTAALLATAAALAVALGAVAAAPGGGGDPAAASGFSDQIAVAWVLVPVVVRSRSGYVEGLARDDFRLWVDERPVAIESFDSGTDAPLSLIFLQDLSGSMATGSRLAASRAALADLVAATRRGDELALASFAGDRLAVDVPFTADRGVFAESMSVWSPYGTTALHDAVAWIPEISLTGRHPKRAVVLVTDGVDNASAVPPEAARRAVENAHLPVYVLGLGDRRLPGAGEDGAGADGYAQLLGRLARATGGRYFPIADPADAAAAVAALVDDLRAQYVLGFPAAGDGPRRYRRFRVEPEGRGHEAVFRVGYTGGPPTAWAPADRG
jgi:Ca-activated chloride channel homolog